RGNEVIIGDNLASGDATGGKPDRLGGNVGSETIVGDSAVTGSGTASGGADELNHALDSVIMIGDSATLTGTASGGGHDDLHGSTGGDFHQPCNGCDNRLYGDSYALTTDGSDSGAGNDLLTSGLGDQTYLDGQGSDPDGGGR